jgi:hypothetical protein
LNHRFSADSGDSKTLDLMMPGAPEDPGITLHAGRSYKFQLSMFERDTGGGDFMGGVQRVLDQSNGWGVGLHEQEPAAPFADRSLPTGDIVCAGCGGIIVGDYLVTYEIRLSPLPDLRPTAIRVLGAEPGDTSGEENVCLGVQNAGQADSGAFQLNLYVENTLARNGSVGVVGLAAGASHESCIRTFLPTSGLHRLRLVVDQYRAVAELNEQNNHIDEALDRGPAQPVQAPAGAGPASPNTGSASAEQGTPGQKPVTPAPQADLTVSAIRVRDRVPDGKDDCKDGKNRVAVVVKNGGKANAGPFAVRLDVDGDQADEALISALEAGQEQEVRFDDVRLKKGARTFVATLDPKNAVAESNEDNNELKVAATCKDDD